MIDDIVAVQQANHKYIELNLHTSTQEAVTADFSSSYTSLPKSSESRSRQSKNGLHELIIVDLNPPIPISVEPSERLA